jgi:hypothetical protein
LVTFLELIVFPTLTWAVRLHRKSFTMLYVLWGHFIFLSFLG